MSVVEICLWAYLVGAISDVFASLGRRMPVWHAVVLAPLWLFTLIARLLNRV